MSRGACARCGCAYHECECQDGRPTSHPHLLPASAYPLTIKIVSGTTGEIVWSRKIDLIEAKTLAKIEIPSFKDTEHYPVRTEIEYADGTKEVEGMS